MRIAFFTINIDQVGGIESVITNLSNYFVNKYNYQVEVISLFGKEKVNCNTKLDKKIKRVYLDLNLLSENNRFSQLFNSYKYGRLLQDFFKHSRYDFIISTHFVTNMISIINKKNINGKIIGSEHSEYYQAGKLTRILRSTYYKKLDKFIVLTNEQKELYGRYLKNVKVINNAISFKSKEYSSCENKKIITAGRLSHEKGFDRIIDIFKIISEKHNEWTLDIFGEGEEKKFLQDKIDKYDLNNKIKIHPFTNKMKEELLESSIYVLPSRSEAFSLALIEAMECGLPAISFETSGPKEIILNNEDGILVEKNNINKFAEVLGLLTEDVDIRKKYGAEAKKNIKRFHIENIGNEWIDLFGNMLH